MLLNQVSGWKMTYDLEHTVFNVKIQHWEKPYMKKNYAKTVAFDKLMLNLEIKAFHQFSGIQTATGTGTKARCGYRTGRFGIDR